MKLWNCWWPWWPLATSPAWFYTFHVACLRLSVCARLYVGRVVYVGLWCVHTCVHVCVYSDVGGWDDDIDSWQWWVGDSSLWCHSSTTSSLVQTSLTCCCCYCCCCWWWWCWWCGRAGVCASSSGARRWLISWRCLPVCRWFIINTDDWWLAAAAAAARRQHHRHFTVYVHTHGPASDRSSLDVMSVDVHSVLRLWTTITSSSSSSSHVA